ncbi:MAG: aminotransferase class V-fold PLP-dependent enzyme [Deltaproteobacteria bacterium]|nr:aminotransferase class V-fold PLP-dependent enzyme [Deltaproteobacteria bacterium]
MSDPLAPDRALLERWLAVAGEAVIAHVERAATARADGVVGHDAWWRAAALSRPITEAPAASIEDAMATLEAASELALNTIGPGYLAYVPGGGLFASALGSFVGAAYNRFTGMAAAAPGFARLEADVLAWLAAEVGYDDRGAAGLFTSGGSMANFSAVVTARHDRLGDDGDLRAATVYASREAHRSVAKAARLAGIPPHNVREVAVDAAFRMRPDALSAAIDADLAAGRRPFLVVANAGSTNTGAIDPMGALAAVCATHGAWLHVDGAYGGAFVLCDEGRAKLAGLDRADSITLDPHKGLFLPYGLGCLLVRDGARLRAAHSEDAAYLQDLAAAGEAVPSPADHGSELSREYRGVKLWLPLMLHGAGAFRAALAEKLTLARRFRDGLRDLPLEVAVEPELTVVAFRCALRAGEPPGARNRRTQALLDAVNAAGHALMSSTLLDAADGPALTIRCCVLSYRTHAEHIDQALADVRAAVGAA